MYFSKASVILLKKWPERGVQLIPQLVWIPWVRFIVCMSVISQVPSRSKDISQLTGIRETWHILGEDGMVVQARYPSSRCLGRPDGWSQTLMSPSRLGSFRYAYIYAYIVYFVILDSYCTTVAGPPLPLPGQQCAPSSTKLFSRIIQEVLAVLIRFTGCLYFWRNELVRYFYCVYITITKCWTWTDRLFKTFLFALSVPTPDQTPLSHSSFMPRIHHF